MPFKVNGGVIWDVHCKLTILLIVETWVYFVSLRVSVWYLFFVLCFQMGSLGPSCRSTFKMTDLLPLN